MFQPTLYIKYMIKIISPTYASQLSKIKVAILIGIDERQLLEK